MRGKRNYRLAALVVGAFGVANTGCSTMNNTEKGALGGGAIGAGAGALIGSASGNPKTGAVIGGLIGAGTGGLIGNSVDRADAKEATARRDAAQVAYVNAQPDRLAEVVSLTKSGQSEQVIINHIRNHRMSFNLSVADLDYLKTNGVSERVIAEMQSGSPRVVVAPPRTVVVQEQPQTVIVREPYYGPPAVIVAPRPYYGGGYYRRW